MSKNAHIIRDEAEIEGIVSELAPAIRADAVARDAKRQLPVEALGLIAESGLLALNVPADFGGIQASAETIVAACRRIAQADSSVAQYFQPHFAAVDVVSRVGDDDQKSLFFSEVLDGAWIGNATAEIGGKRGVENLKTQVVEKRPGGDYLLSGKKFYATGADNGRWIAVMAKEPLGRVGIALVPHNATGVSIDQDWIGFGQRGTASGTAIFDNVVVPREHFLERWRIFEAPQTHGAFTQLHHIALDLGTLDAVIADAVHYVKAKSRPSGDSPYDRNDQDPVVINTFGGYEIAHRAASALVTSAARTYDRLDPLVRCPLPGGPDSAEACNQISLEIAAAKAFTAEQALKISSAIFEFMGASGTSSAYGYDRHWRNARTHSLHDPVRWKTHHIGNWLLNKVRVPSSGII